MLVTLGYVPCLRVSSITVPGALRVATCSPFETNALDDLATMLSVEVEPVLAPRTEITDLINKAYKRKADVVDEAGDGVALDEFRRTVERAEERRLGLFALAPLLGFLVADGARADIGVDGQLLP